MNVEALTEELNQLRQRINEIESDIELYRICEEKEKALKNGDVYEEDNTDTIRMYVDGDKWVFMNDDSRGTFSTLPTRDILRNSHKVDFKDICK